MRRALSKNEDGLIELDMNVIRQLCDEFDAGCDSEECIVAKFILTAYETGFDHGVTESEDRQAKTALLLMHTEGHA